MYHIELRQFPHNLCRFNLREPELRARILDSWVREEWIELGERKWSPHQAKLTVIEGPEIPVAQLTMGRGWRTACREGEDVTARILEEARNATAGGASTSPVPAGLASQPPEPSFAADSVGLELLAGIADAQVPLRRAWDVAAARFPEHSASESLAVAERAVASLLRSRLLLLFAGDPSGEGVARELDLGQAEVALRAHASWSVSAGSGEEQTSSVSIRRA